MSLNATALLHLLQLASPSLPVGAYSYSQGLEAAIEGGQVHHEASARDWIVDMLHEVVARFEGPVSGVCCTRSVRATRRTSAIGTTISSPPATVPNFALKPYRWAIRWASWWAN